MTEPATDFDYDAVEDSTVGKDSCSPSTRSDCCDRAMIEFIVKINAANLSNEEIGRRIKILGYVTRCPGGSNTIRQLAAKVGIPKSTMQRQLDKFKVGHARFSLSTIFDNKWDKKA